VADEDVGVRNGPGRQCEMAQGELEIGRSDL
jgi:hypothetical protein